MFSEHVLEQISRLPPEQQSQMVDLIKINQAKDVTKQRAEDLLNNFMKTQMVSNFVGINSRNNIK